MTRSTRLFEIIQLLRQAKGPLTAATLAEQLEVTDRTIYRDIAVLQARRVPIVGEAGVGYVLRRGFDLPPLMFDAEEMEAIFVGLALLGRTRDHGLTRAAERVAAKIAEVLPSEVVGDEPVLVSTWTNVPKSRVDTRELRRRIRESAKVRIRYLDLKNRRTDRTILPLAMIYFVDAVILAAWCELREGFRHFRIDRIESCEPTGETDVELSVTLFKEWQRETPFSDFGG